MHLFIKQSKANPFRQVVEAFLGHSGTSICPVQALMHYIKSAVSHLHQPHSLYSQHGMPLTRSYLVTNLQATLRQAGLDDSPFYPHSFRIAIEMTAQQGVERCLGNGAVMHTSCILNCLELNRSTYLRHLIKAQTSYSYFLAMHSCNLLFKI